MSDSRPLVLLLQLPIPPPGMVSVCGNVPLAAGYLHLFARRRGLEERYRIEILSPQLVNSLGDQGLAREILRRRPWMVGFTCYLWNIDRSLWVAAQLKAAQPDVRIVLGGPEITTDNAWVLDHAAVDFAVFGEGEQTFAELLGRLAVGPAAGVPGLWMRGQEQMPPPRTPLADLADISSPYLDGILDATDERMLLLETARGCIFKCRFCYYPKSYDKLYQLSYEHVAANLQHAAQRGAREVFLLDPTLNQRRDFPDLLRLLARHNPGRRGARQFTYSAELRAEGITAETARLLAEANFTEVEVGLQSIERQAQDLMDRRVNQKAFQRGTQAMLDAGIKVRVDLILGLPGDTVDSVRRGIDYLAGLRPRCEAQIFNLSILPGTAFREDATGLGLKFQPRPPYYVLNTPTFRLEDLYRLMDEAHEALGIEFDPLPPPLVELPAADANEAGPAAWAVIDLDGTAAGPPQQGLPPALGRAQAFVLWLKSADFSCRRREAAAAIARVLDDNPHTTLQVVLEPVESADPAARLECEVLEELLAASFRTTSYLDRYYSLHPARLLGAKRLVVLLPVAQRGRLGQAWADDVGQYATLVWRGGGLTTEDLADHEYTVDG